MKNRGISLIVLITTIIVILILATAIIINMQETNIIDNAEVAVIKSDIKTFEEELSMYISDEYVETIGEFEETELNADKTTNPSVYDILKKLENSKYKDDIIIQNGKIILAATADDIVKEAVKDISNNIVTYDIVEVGETAENNNSLFTGSFPAYNNPIIPVGFRPINTDDASWLDKDKDGIVDDWNKGLVIQDEDLNEFVWVPCTIDGKNDTIKYARNVTYGSNYGSNNSNTVDNSDTLPSNVLETNQIKKYGGFYVGRYEAGICEDLSDVKYISNANANITGKPVSKPNWIKWTAISPEMANNNAKLFVDTEYVKSGIITGTAWDTICEWIASEKDEEGISVHSIINSSSWGDYNNDPVDGNKSESRKTGYSDSWKAKNIYEFAGSVWEWTGEKRITSNEMEYAIMRGGHGGNSGSGCPVTYRWSYDNETYGTGIGFRIQLYIM